MPVVRQQAREGLREDLTPFLSFSTVVLLSAGQLLSAVSAGVAIPREISVGAREKSYERQLDPQK
jgi:hypothetical protein